MDIMLRKR